MKTRVPRFFFGAFAVGAIVLLAQNVQSQILYSDTNTSQNANYNYNNSEAGNEVVLAGTAFTDMITNFQFQFDFVGPNGTSGTPSGGEKADLRFYANNGPLVHGYPSPGTLLFDSGTFSIGGFTAGTVAIFNQAALNGGVIVPQDFTWTVTFSGLSGSENAGLAIYSPETIGTSYSDAWVRTNSGTWGLQVAQISSPPLDFAALASGAPYFESYSLTNGTAITINNDTFNSGKAVNGYPSTITVPAVLGNSTLEKVTVNINGFTHAYPNDVELLLVAPNGSAVALMGNDGGGVGVTNFTLTFDDAPNVFLQTLSTIAPLTNGATYHSGDSSAFGTTQPFPSPAPAVNQANLTGFNGLAPASYTGTWSLYVLDDSQPNTGSIASWSLNLYTTPVVGVTNTSVTLNENQSVNFYFTVSDPSSSAILTPSITLSGLVNGNYAGQFGAFISNNIPANFAFTPTNPSPNGTNMVTITPYANLYGTANFTINVTDGNGGTAASAPISLTVTHVPIAPKISLANPTITTSNGVASALNLMSLISVDGNVGSSMALSVSATNGAGAGLVNLGNVGVNSNVFTNTVGLNPVVGITNNFNFSIVPGGFPIGTNYLNFIATDTTPGVGLSATQVVTVIVAPLTNGLLTGPLVYSNTNSLIVPLGTSAQLANITINNLTRPGTIGGISVSLLGLTNIIPSSLGLELQAPDGTLVPLVGSAPSATSSTYAELTFADKLGTPNVAVNNVLPASGTGANSLSNYVLNATAGTAALASALGGHSLNNAGVWTLWVTNYSGAQPLGISGGWGLDVYPAPVVTEPVPVASISMPELATTNVVFVTSDTVGTQNAAPTILLNPTTTATYSGTALATATMLPSGGTAVVGGTTYTVGSATIGGTNYTTNIMQLTGNYNEAGSVFVTNFFSEANKFGNASPNIFTATNTLTLTVNFVPQSPTIGFIENQVTYAGEPVLNLPFVISSADTNAANLTITVTAGNPALLPTSGNWVVTRGSSSGAPPPSPSWQTNYLSLYPVGIKGGSSTIAVVVSDGQSTPVTNQFLLTVTAPGSPLAYNASPISIGAVNTSGSPYPSTNQVTGLVGTVENVVVTLFGVTYNNDATGLNLLLVGPTNAQGQSPAVYLMGDAGQGAALTNVNLTFSNSLSGPNNGAILLPAVGQIASTNIYYPTNYRANAYTTPAPAPAPAPGAGYGTNLVSSFKGINPNGTWSLYAFDTNGSKGGLIAEGWQLSIVTAPNILPTTTNYSTLENVPTNFAITVGDAEAAAIFVVTNYVTASGSSSQPSITIPNPVPVTNNGTVNLAAFTVTPNPYQFGTNNILVVATDANGSASSNNLQFIVTQVQQPPLILVTNLTLSTPAGVPLNNIPFAVWDVQTINQNSISVSSTGLAPAPVITVITNFTFNGTNVYSLNIQPVGVGIGTATIALAVTDGMNNTSKTNFMLTVTPNLAFAGPGAITLGPGYPVQALGSPYPSTINVTNVAGTVSGVQVELIGFTHNDASDVDVLLVGPNGKSAILMANAGDQLPANNVTLQFSQTAASAIPQFSQLTSGTYLPTNYASSLVFSNPAPSSGYLTNLSTAFIGSTPSGAWSLYAMDTLYPDSGSIGSWILFLQTGPALNAIANQTVAENNSISVPLTLTDSSTGLSNLTVTISSFTNAANVTVTVQGNGTPSGPTNLLITPNVNYPSSVQNANVTNSITVTVSDTNNPPNTVTGTFNLVIQEQNQLPVIVSASPSPLQINENQNAQITFTFSNVDATLFPSNLSLTCTNSALVAASGISTSSTIAAGGLAKGSLGTVVYTVTPPTNVFGTNQNALIFSVSNTNKLTNTMAVNLNINHVIQPPVVAPFFSGNYSLKPGTTSTNITFNAISFESNATLTITASSATPSEVPNSPANIVISQTSFTNATPSTNTGTIMIIIPSGTPAGTSVITVTNTQVVAGVTNTGTASFTIQVTASSTTVFANTSSVSVNNGVPSPYPSTIAVAGLIGNVNAATVTLNSLSASFPSNVSILLQGPNGGPSVLLLSGAGGTNASSNMTLTFADTNALGSATSALAANGGSALLHATSYNGETNALPGAAPAPPYYDRFAVFNGVTPNGTWSLWVADTNTGDTVSILNGWSLSISTTPQISLDTNPPPASLSIPENAPGQNNQGTVSYHVVDSTGSSVTVSVIGTPSTLFSTISAGANSGLTAINGFTNDYTATITPAAYQTGNGTLTFNVFRSTDGASNSVSYPVTIIKSNMPPTMTRLGPITINENGSNTTEFIVTELGDPLSTVTVLAYSSNTSVLANSGLTFSTGSTTANPGTFFKTNVVNLTNFASSTVPNSADLVLNIAPIANQVGTAVVGILVSNADGAFNSPIIITNGFTNTVNSGMFNPTFAGVPSAAVSVIGGNTASVSFQVNSADATPPIINVSAVNQSAPNGETLMAPVSSLGTAQYNGTTSNTPGATWTVALATQPTSNPSGVKSIIQLTATDANGLTAVTNFTVLAMPGQQHYYSNAAPINIVDVSPSIPSPSTIGVSGLVGLVSQVIVTVNSFGHQYPSDVGMLLVGPNGINTVLMNNAGSGVPVTGLNLTFSTNAAGPVPAAQALTTGTFLASDYQPSKPYNFETSGINNTPTYSATNPAPPPGPYATNMNVFAGLNPNTNWYLYVQDDSAGDVGYISNGWTLQIFTQPMLQITGLASITNAEGSANGKTTFVVLDDSPAVYSASSFGSTNSNPTLLPPGSVTFSGSGTNWTVNFNPAVNVAGNSVVTIFSTNSYGQIASASFSVTITPVNFPPVVFLPTNGSVLTIPAGTPSVIALGYSDTGYNTNTLVVTATSAALGANNPIPASSLAFVPGIVGGPSNLVITPAGLVTGSNTITVTVTQPILGGSSATNMFTVIVAPSTVPVFNNTAPIAISANSAASPYPSQITVSGVGANILKVTATLIGFSHTFPSDVSALLVGPQGQKVMLMSDEGGGIGVSNLRLTFDDAGAAMSASGPLTSGTNAPATSDLNFLNSLPDITNFTAAAAPPYLHTMSAFSNTIPNGTWSLYVYDNNSPDTGTISGGWQLNIQTIGPMVTPLSPVTISENTSVTIPFSIASASTYASNITVTAAASGQIPTGLVSSLVVAGAGTSNETLTITPTTNYPSAVTNINGTAAITLTLTDTNHNSSTNTFPLTVLYVDIPPAIILPVAQTNTPANIGLAVPFTTSDVQGTTSLAVTASLSPSLGTVGITTNGPGNYTLTFTPNGTAGQTTVSVVASDGTVFSTNTLPITVTAGLVPAVTIVSSTNTLENTTLTVPFTLANVTATFASTNIVGSASNTNVVQSVSISGAGSNFTAKITLVPYRNGSSTVTITATDQFGAGAGSTALTVTPVEYPPTLGPIANTSTLLNTPVNVVLNVVDLGTSISNLIYSANITSPNVIGAVNFFYNGTNEIATIVPASYEVGSSTIAINVSDGVTNVYQIFTVTVTAPPGPTLGPIASTNTPINTSVAVVLPVADPNQSVGSLSYSSSITGTNVISSVSILFNGVNEVATIRPVANQTGTGIITVTVSDGFTNASQSFAVTVVPVEHPPTLAAIPDTNTTANTTVNVVLKVADSVTNITSLAYSADISDSNVVAAVNISYNGTNEVAAIVPATNKIGIAAITINVSDGVTNIYQVFYVTVTAPTPPTLGLITNQYAVENTAVLVPLSVTSPVTPVTNLQFSASVTPASLVGSFAFAYNGTNEVATITPAANATGVGTVTMSVNDLFTTNSQTFTLQVNPTNLPALTSTPGENLSITFTGLPGGTYYIQSSTNLTTWTTIATVTANAVTGAVQYNIIIPKGAGAAFYRLEVP